MSIRPHSDAAYSLEVSRFTGASANRGSAFDFGPSAARSTPSFGAQTSTRLSISSVANPCPLGGSSWTS
jgi:hypothetical protein